MRKSILFAILLTLITGILVIGNPSQAHFLRSVSNDYGAYHQGMNLSPKKLEEIGIGRYHSYMVFSSYEYQFGDISIFYFGFAFMTFYRGSSVKPDLDSRIIQS